VNITENILVSDISRVNMVKLIMNVLNKMIIISFLSNPRAFFLSFLDVPLYIPSLNQQRVREYDSITENLTMNFVL
jgi:hypothetical protein